LGGGGTIIGQLRLYFVVEVRVSDNASEECFDHVMARCGIVVPDDRRAGALATYKELMQMATLLRQPRDAESEPSNVFCLDIVLRCG
jgi:hypothetical protein